MDPALVSVVIPAYNAAATLRQSLAEVRAQQHRPLEIIVVDDGSTDATAEVARNGGATTVIRQDNAGPSAARNAGIRAARGDYIAFLDADDHWTADKLAAQMALFAAHPELGLCFTDAEIQRSPTAGGQCFTVFAAKGLSAAVFGSDWQVVDAAAKLVRDNFITTSSVVVRRAVLPEPAFEPGRRHAEDWQLWLQLALAAPIGYVDAVCVRKREDGSGLSAQRRAMLLSVLEVLERFIAAQGGCPGLPPSAVRELLFARSRWTGEALAELGERCEARACYRKALRSRFDAKTLIRYLQTWLPDPG